ncbi:MAG: hypothetical protein KatS3mg002_1034 [Candidatus Woesearchaeota archaeon]|jgi:hypothetical protein|nr:MAG: hypothetical protein KatS3mg002_1034 [Candidatus Woesearchaeota archaeon]
MPTNTPRLGLKLYDLIADSNQLFSTFVSDIAGSSNSNMTKIDTWSNWVSGSISNLQSAISGSISSINNTLNGYYNNASSISGSMNTIRNRFSTITTFSGSGIFDFNVPQTYNNLLIIGSAKSINRQASAVSITTEFNLDNNSANYISVDWLRWYPSTNWFLVYNNFGAIDTAMMSSSLYADEYPVPFMIYIPNYRDTNSYKTAIGMTTFYARNSLMMHISSGTWNNTSAVTRIRMGTNSSGTFANGTSISVYGLG